VKNNLQMIASLIVMQSRTITDPATKKSLSAMLERIEALSTVHRRLYQSNDVSRFDVADFTRDLVSDLLMAAGRSEIRAELDVAPVVISAQKATPVALMINELVTNALKHAFVERADGIFKGTLGLKVRQSGDRIVIEVSDDGVGMAGEPGMGSFGTRLIRSLARQLHASVEWRSGSPGTNVLIELPAKEMMDIKV